MIDRLNIFQSRVDRKKIKTQAASLVEPTIKKRNASLRDEKKDIKTRKEKGRMKKKIEKHRTRENTCIRRYRSEKKCWSAPAPHCGVVTVDF